MSFITFLSNFEYCSTTSKTFSWITPYPLSVVYRLEVKVEGTPTPQMRWYKQGIEIIPCEEFQIEYLEDDSSVLTVTEVYPDDAGEIVCEAHNELGVATTTTVLQVAGTGNTDTHPSFTCKQTTRCFGVG